MQTTLNNTNYYENILLYKKKQSEKIEVFFDIETAGLGGKFIIGTVLSETNEVSFFKSFKEFLNIIGNYKGEQFILYAHNGGKYDNRYLFQYLYKNGIDMFDIVLINNSLLFSFYYNNKKYSLRDTYLILKSSLKSLSENFISEKEERKRNFDIEKWIKEGCKITTELKEYSKYDVISLKKIFNSFKNIFNDINTNYLTIASISFNHLLQSEYDNKQIKTYTKNIFTKEQENDIRRGYYGARNEIFKFKSKHKIFNYDINSLYPFSFSKDFPVSNSMIFTNNEYDILNLLDKGCLGILNIDIDYNYSYIPLLPYKYNNKLMFVYGNNIRNIFITNIEYDILKNNSKIRINYAYMFLHKKTLFKNFVEKYYKIKREGTGSKKILAKFFLNSCYGKFGMKREKQKILNINMLSDKEINYYKDKWKLLFDGSCYRIVSDLNYSNRKINVLYAIFTTAYARTIMYKYLNEYANNLYYTDTDCLFTDTEINKDYIDENELGKFKLEKVYKEALFISNKFYATIDEDDNENIKIKGVFKEKIDNNKFEYKDINDKIINYETLEQLQENKISKIQFKNKRLLGFLENFKRIEYKNEVDIKQIDVIKDYTNNYDKRIILGNNTEPFSFNSLIMS